MVSSLLAHPANFGRASLHNHVSQFFKINFFSYTYSSYWFCFSGELRLIQVCCTFWVSKDTLDIEGHQITRTQDFRLILTFYMLLLLPCFRFHKEVYCIVQHTQYSYGQSHSSSTVSKYFNLFKMFPLDKKIQEVVIELRNDNQDIYIMQKNMNKFFSKRKKPGMYNRFLTVLCRIFTKRTPTWNELFLIKCYSENSSIGSILWIIFRT